MTRWKIFLLLPPTDVKEALGGGPGGAWRRRQSALGEGREGRGGGRNIHTGEG